MLPGSDNRQDYVSVKIILFLLSVYGVSIFVTMWKNNTI